MLCQFLLYNEVNQLQVYIYPLPLEPPIPPIPPTQVITEHQAELPVLYSRFPLAICFTHGSVSMSILISQFIPPTPSPTVSTCPFSMSVSLFLPCKQVHLHHFSKFHIYALIHDICFSLSHFTLYDRHFLCRKILHLIRKLLAQVFLSIVLTYF